MRLKSNKANQWIDTFFTSKWSIYLIFLITSLIVLPNLARESLWFDEIFSANVSLKVSSLHEMFTQYIFKDVHPPLYPILLYYWSDIIGSSDFSIRLLGYLSILISFSFSYFLLNKYFTRKIAIIFIAISAFTPGILYYAEEARSYALLYGLANVLSILFIIFMLKIKQNKIIHKNLLIAYLIVGILVCYTHFFGYILIFSLSMILLGYSIFLHRKRTIFQLFIISLFIAIFGLVWLFILFYYGDIGDKTNGHFWIKNNYFSLVSGVSGILFGSIKAIAIEAILIILIILPFHIFFNSLKKHSFILLPIFLILAISILVSLHTPITTTRNLIIIIPLILLFITFLIDDSYDKKKILISLYLVVLLISSVWKNFTYEKQDWKGASEYIEKNFDNARCQIPISSRIDKSTSQNFLMYPSYYLGTKFSYSANGPELQNSCNLIYFDGHTNKERINKLLSEKKITVPYKILDFNGVYVVIKNDNSSL